jgi:hypothetical protein
LPGFVKVFRRDNVPNGWQFFRRGKIWVPRLRHFTPFLRGVVFVFEPLDATEIALTHYNNRLTLVLGGAPSRQGSRCAGIAT